MRKTWFAFRGLWMQAIVTRTRRRTPRWPIAKPDSSSSAIASRSYASASITRSRSARRPTMRLLLADVDRHLLRFRCARAPRRKLSSTCASIAMTIPAGTAADRLFPGGHQRSVHHDDRRHGYSFCRLCASGRTLIRLTAIQLTGTKPKHVSRQIHVLLGLVTM